MIIQRVFVSSDSPLPTQGNTPKMWKGYSSEAWKTIMPAKATLSSMGGEGWVRSGEAERQDNYYFLRVMLFWIMGTIYLYPQKWGWYLELNIDIIRKKPRSGWHRECLKIHCQKKKRKYTVILAEKSQWKLEKKTWKRETNNFIEASGNWKTNRPEFKEMPGR